MKNKEGFLGFLALLSILILVLFLSGCNGNNTEYVLLDITKARPVVNVECFDKSGKVLYKETNLKYFAISGGTTKTTKINKCVITGENNGRNKI